MCRMSLLQIENVTKIYNEGSLSETKVLENSCFELAKGEFVVVIGPSGSGKTTLLNILGLLDRNYKGTYRIHLKDVKTMSNNQLARYRNEVFGMVFQDYILLENQSAYENILGPLYYSKKYPRNKRKERINDIAKQLEIDGVLNRAVKNLSGGQRQRVAIARAIINDPDILLMDEPTASLNEDLAHDIMGFIVKFSEKNQKSVVLVTHDTQNIPQIFETKYSVDNYTLQIQ